MIPRRPATRCRHIVRDMTPLVEFYQRFRPTCHVIHIHRLDWEAIRQAGDGARSHGFVVEEEPQTKISYKGFELQPVDQGTPHL